MIGIDTDVLVQPFRTTSNPNLAGDINLAEAVGFEPVNRRLWISETPGGPSIDDIRCGQSGNSSRKISWSQSENRSRCVLKTNSNYFLNIQQISGCGPGEDCTYYRTMATNANNIGDPGAVYTSSLDNSQGDELSLKINWSSPGGRKTYSIPSQGLVLPFETNSSPDYGGRINAFEVVGEESVVRRISISSSPGTSLSDTLCTREGSGLISIPWIQQPYSGACSLKLNTRYYLEIENVSGCNGSCDTYLTIPTNGLSAGESSSVATSCTESSTQKCGEEINWASPGPQITAELRGTSEVISWPFSTTGDPTYNGLVTISETTGFGGVSRKMWFSDEPNGPAISPTCSSEGVSTRTFYWTQSSAFERGYPCQLDTSKQYYMNVANTAGCAAANTCSFIRNFSS
jgi:hypothetical protein